MGENTGPGYGVWVQALQPFRSRSPNLLWELLIPFQRGASLKHNLVIDENVDDYWVLYMPPSQFSFTCLISLLAYVMGTNNLQVNTPFENVKNHQWSFLKLTADANSDKLFHVADQLFFFPWAHTLFKKRNLVSRKNVCKRGTSCLREVIAQGGLTVFILEVIKYSTAPWNNTLCLLGANSSKHLSACALASLKPILLMTFPYDCSMQLAHVTSTTQIIFTTVAHNTKNVVGFGNMF